MLTRRVTFALALSLVAQLTPHARVRACECVARPPHALGENGSIPENGEGVFLHLPKRGDFRVEATTVRNGETQPCRSELHNSPLPYLRELNLRCSLRGAQSLRVDISTHGKPIHTSEFSVSKKAKLPTAWGTFSAKGAGSMKVRVAQPMSCRQTVNATGTTLRFNWSKEATPWASVALFVHEVDGQLFANQKHDLCDGHLSHVYPTSLGHTHLFATEFAMEQQNETLKPRTVGVQVLMPGRRPVPLPKVQVALPARLSGRPVEEAPAASESSANTVAAKRVSKIIDRCRGKEAGEVVAKVKVAGLTGQVLSTQVRAPNTKISACVRKRTQAQKFEARGGGKDYEFELRR